MQTVTKPQSKSRIHEIDGLRGVAILSIIFLHWIIQPLSPLISELSVIKILDLFAYGVDLFFVISGFLIGGILLKVGKKPSGITVFYVRRILRIWPLYFLLVGFVYFSDIEQKVYVEIPYWSFFLFIYNFWESIGLNIHPA